MASSVIGSIAPDFEIEVAEENGDVTVTQLATLRPDGQALVIDFFAPWCKSCPAAAQKLEELAGGEYGNNCKCVIVCVDGGIEAAREFASAHGIQKCIVAAVVDDDAPDS
jgi:thiol-disulfide isomerase/thioredoxin